MKSRLIAAFRRFSRRRWLWMLLGLVSLVLLLPRLFFWLTEIKPPREAGRGVIRPQSEVRDGRIYVGESWMSRERGLLELHLAGEPFVLGYSHGRLGTPYLVQIEDYLFGEMRRYVPSSLALSAIKTGVMLKQRNLLDAVPVPLRFELAGLAEAQPDGQGDFLPPFQRVVFYHALHDITQTIEHSPLLGCTAVAASGSATTDGHLYIGRNFDFEGPPMFDSDKAILFFRPQDKLAFASVAWTGMAGVVTGLNEAGIYVSVNALRTDDKSDHGIPVELLLRDVLERAHSLDEAIAVAKEHAVLVPDLYLFADGKTGESAVIERSPTRFEVIRNHDVIAVANHARSSPFAGDQANERLRTYLTSGARQARADELLARYRGSLDANGVLQILRDKKGVGDKELGLGNRNALDAIIATHSVVVDATDRVIWVAKGPHALGEYVGFDLRKELGDKSRVDPASLAEDPVLHSADYRNHRMMAQSLHAAEVAKKRDQLELAIEEAQRAVSLSPLSADAQQLLADLLWSRAMQSRNPSHRQQATQSYSTFLKLSPPHRVDVEQAEQRLKQLAASAP